MRCPALAAPLGNLKAPRLVPNSFTVRCPTRLRSISYRAFERYVCRSKTRRTANNVCLLQSKRANNREVS